MIQRLKSQKLTLLIFSFTLLSGLSFAGASEGETYRRRVNFEWDAIDGASAYEIELKLDKDQKSEKNFAFKSKEAAWNGKLTPGKYLMRLRARDYRGVPGDWSPFSDFNVGLDSVQIKYPNAHIKILDKESSETNISFQWAAVNGASGYHFELNSDDKQVNILQEVTDTKIKIKIPVAKNYTWKVTAYNKNLIESEGPTISDFSLLGKILDAPQIERPESNFVRELKWKRPDNAENFDVYLLRYNRENKKWDKFQTFENYKDTVLPFEKSWPGGKYQAVVRAKGSLRGSSPLAKSSFDVLAGDRSPASEYTALVRKSIDRVTGWYGIASYLITQIQFTGHNPENNSAVAYNAMGGTGRLGAGWFSPNNPWGFLGIIDLSGFSFSGKINTFASVETSSVYKQNIGERGECRVQLGGYYKELPETIGDPISSTSVITTIRAIGPHVGAEYWYSISPKLGIQANIHGYLSLLKISTPNGQALSPTLSTQVGFLGSYRFSPTLTGLLGYARREEKMAYKVDSSAPNFSASNAGDTNTTNVSGNYLNFFAEWSF